MRKGWGGSKDREEFDGVNAPLEEVRTKRLKMVWMSMGTKGKMRMRSARLGWTGPRYCRHHGRRIQRDALNDSRCRRRASRRVQGL